MKQQKQKQKELDLLEWAALDNAARCMRVLSHPVRLRIVDILMQAELAVYEIARICDLPHHQATEHLRLLKGYGLLGSSRRGREVYYFIADNKLPGLLNCIRKNCNSSK